MADPITNSVVGIAGSVLNKFVADKNLKMQLEHELKALRRAVKGQAVGGVRPSARPPSGQPTAESRPSLPPRDQPREWRGLV